MKTACPFCGSTRLRTSRRRGWLEVVWGLLGSDYLKCRACGERFRHDLLDVANWRYARCPRCYRLDLTSWDESHYHVPPGAALLLRLGARRHRCEACRSNFVSFRSRKRIYQLQRRAG